MFWADRRRRVNSGPVFNSRPLVSHLQGLHFLYKSLSCPSVSRILDRLDLLLSSRLRLFRIRLLIFEPARTSSSGSSIMAAGPSWEDQIVPTLRKRE